MAEFTHDCQSCGTPDITPTFVLVDTGPDPATGEPEVYKAALCQDCAGRELRDFVWRLGPTLGIAWLKSLDFPGDPGPSSGIYGEPYDLDAAIDSGLCRNPSFTFYSPEEFGLKFRDLID